MGVDLEIYTNIELRGGKLTNKRIKNLDKWIAKKSKNFFGWEVKYHFDSFHDDGFHDDDSIEIKLESGARGTIDDYIKILIEFLIECEKYSFFAQDSVPYMMSWGDWESGSVYISTAEKKSLIIGISNFGDISNREIEYDNKHVCAKPLVGKNSKNESEKGPDLKTEIVYFHKGKQILDLDDYIESRTSRKIPQVRHNQKCKKMR